MIPTGGDFFRIMGEILTINYPAFLIRIFSNNQNPGSQFEKWVICFNQWIVPRFRSTGESYNFMDVPIFKIGENRRNLRIRFQS